MPSNFTEIQQKWSYFRQAHPHARHFDAAHHLGLSEELLVAANCGISSRQLQPKFEEFFKKLESLGRVMALTRNPHVVIEKEGVYREVSFHGKMGLVLDAEIDLRLFLKHWSTLFAISLETATGVRYGFHIFDHQGQAIHKIYLTKDSKLERYENLILEIGLQNSDTKVFTGNDLPTEQEDNKQESRIFNDERKQQFLGEWSCMKDSHDFLSLLKKYELTRYEALLAGVGRFTEKVPPDFPLELFAAAAGEEVPIMVFVGNSGCIEIHSGLIRRCVTKGDWFNILDQGFNLHLNKTGIKEVYLVEKPTADGLVTSLELFDKDGELILQIFGQRKPGMPELETWRKLLRKSEITY